ncbi:Tyrosine-protein kinase [Trichinella spiralis]|uniref:Tyrosine-protein kinase n=1 Tax=Trichinella spiralis TaxID=6334 RepID=A0ABR3KPB7_TRISP
MEHERQTDDSKIVRLTCNNQQRKKPPHLSRSSTEALLGCLVGILSLGSGPDADASLLQLLFNSTVRCEFISLRAQKVDRHFWKLAIEKRINRLKADSIFRLLTPFTFNRSILLAKQTGSAYDGDGDSVDLDFRGSSVKRQRSDGWLVGRSGGRPSANRNEQPIREQAWSTNQFASELTGRQFPGSRAHCRSGSRRTTLGKKENFHHQTLDALRKDQLPSRTMRVTAETPLLTTVKWDVENAPFLNEFVDRYPLPHVALVTKGQHLGVGLPNVSNPTLKPYLLAYAKQRSRKLLGTLVKIKDGKRSALSAASVAIPLEYGGYFEILSEDGHRPPCFETVGELAAHTAVDQCLVRQRCKAYLPDADGELKTLRRSRAVLAGEVLTVVGQFRLKRVWFLRCFDEAGRSLFFKAHHKGRFSALAKAESVGGVHTAASLASKRLPLTVRLVHGHCPAEVAKLAGNAEPIIRLRSVYEEQFLLAYCLQKSEGQLLSIPLNAHLKLAPAVNYPQMVVHPEFRQLCAYCAKLAPSFSNRLSLLHQPDQLTARTSAFHINDADETRQEAGRGAGPDPGPDPGRGPGRGRLLPSTKTNTNCKRCTTVSEPHRRATATATGLGHLVSSSNDRPWSTIGQTPVDANSATTATVPTAVAATFTVNPEDQPPVNLLPLRNPITAHLPQLIAHRRIQHMRQFTPLTKCNLVKRENENFNDHSKNLFFCVLTSGSVVMGSVFSSIGDAFSSLCEGFNAIFAEIGKIPEYCGCLRGLSEVENIDIVITR